MWEQYLLYGILGIFGTFAILEVIIFTIIFVNQALRDRHFRQIDQQRAFNNALEQLEEYNRIHFGE